MTPLLVLAAAFTLLPLLVFRGVTLRRALSLELLTYAAAWLLWRQSPGFDPFTAMVYFGTLKLALFALQLGAAPDRETRWSANHAAAIATIVFAMAMPAMMRVPIDGDEPYYLLVTESIVHDGDLDLANQYRNMAASATLRPDLQPYAGDPTGPNGEQYSRHEPFLSLLMVPGYLAGGLAGAIATIALFGVLLVRSTFRMLDDEGVPPRVQRALFPFFAFAPPVLFYAIRIWPEVPGAFFFVEALRGVRQRRMQRWAPALIGLVLLKLRFVLVAGMLIAPLLVEAVRRRSSRDSMKPHRMFIALLILAVPMAVLWLLTGSATNVHRFSEFVPAEPLLYLRGLFGLLLDGMGGLAFQAPFYLLGVYAITRWRSMPETFRIGCVALLLYLALLLPRPEWHGGWAPPLRYVVIAMPILLLGASRLWERVPSGLIALIAAWTIGLVAHGLAAPWRLFHIMNGENLLGETLSRMYRSDYSRVFPSFIRVNEAAYVAAAGLVLLFVVARFVRIPTPAIITIATMVLAFALAKGRIPGDVIEFEDAHVDHHGGELHPPFYTSMRYIYRPGWLLHEGESVSFLAREGPYVLWYSAGTRLMIDIDHHAFQLPPTGAVHQDQPVFVPRTGRVTLRCVSGTVNLDRMIHAR
jgi:hypothetical protein